MTTKSFLLLVAGCLMLMLTLADPATAAKSQWKITEIGYTDTVPALQPAATPAATVKETLVRTEGNTEVWRICDGKTCREERRQKRLDNRIEHSQQREVQHASNVVSAACNCETCHCSPCRCAVVPANGGELQIIDTGTVGGGGQCRRGPVRRVCCAIAQVHENRHSARCCRRCR
jgi:hypothetical protein